MTAQTAPRVLPDTYFQLIKQFPLVHLRNDADLEAAQAIIDRLLDRAPEEGTQEYLNVLTDLVEAYEDENHSMPDASQADVLRELMRTNGLSQPKLAKETRIAQSTLSAVLNGTRSLTRKQVVTLARFFHVSPAAFLPA
jgi:HTH-type transcriptional regulator/antitoxin HigA